MTAQVRRIYVEKKEGFDMEARNLGQDLRDNLGISELEGVRIQDINARIYMPKANSGSLNFRSLSSYYLEVIWSKGLSRNIPCSSHTSGCFEGSYCTLGIFSRHPG
jgi:hypothetical protein